MFACVGRNRNLKDLNDHDKVGKRARKGGWAQREFVIDNLLVRIHFIIVMIRWTGLAPWEFEFPLGTPGVAFRAWWSDDWRVGVRVGG